MFSVNNWLMKTIKGMIGNYPDFQVREWASDWYRIGKITEDNLAELDAIIENQHIELPFVDVPQTTEEYIEDYIETDYVDEREVE